MPKMTTVGTHYSTALEGCAERVKRLRVNRYYGLFGVSGGSDLVKLCFASLLHTHHTWRNCFEGGGKGTPGVCWRVLHRTKTDSRKKSIQKAPTCAALPATYLVLLNVKFDIVVNMPLPKAEYLAGSTFALKLNTDRPCDSHEHPFSQISWLQRGETR